MEEHHTNSTDQNKNPSFISRKSLVCAGDDIGIELIFDFIKSDCVRERIYKHAQDYAGGF